MKLPMPGPWKVVIDQDTTRIEGPNHEDIADIGWPSCAEIIARAPDMAAEIDRLKAINAVLVAVCKEAYTVFCKQGRSFEDGMMHRMEHAILKGGES